MDRRRRGEVLWPVGYEIKDAGIPPTVRRPGETDADVRDRLARELAVRDLARQLAERKARHRARGWVA